jgi:hypothetical protein
MRRRVRAAGVVMVLLLGSLGALARAEGTPPVIRQESYALCGLTIGDSEARVQEILGRPKSFALEPSPIFGDREVAMRWPGIETSFLDTELVNLTVRSSRCKSPDGLAVGASLESAFALLGAAQAEPRKDGSKLYRYWLEGTYAYFLIFAHGDKIIRLELWADFT